MSEKNIYVTPAQVQAAQILLRRQASNREALRAIANAQPEEINMDYEHEQRALVYALGGGGLIRDELKQLSDDEMDTLADALEDLAQIVDEQAILRAKKRQ